MYRSVPQILGLGAMRGIKIPRQDFALKTQGGLMREGARICGTLRYYIYTTLLSSWRVEGVSGYETTLNFVIMLEAG